MSEPLAGREPPAGPVARPEAPVPLVEASFAGTPPFPRAAEAALADPTLRTNLRRATTTIRAKRAQAVAERDDWEALRTAGAAIKDAALARLPDLLVELEARVTAAGGQVHWAADAAEAAAIVTRIVAGHGVREVVKVKSMTSVEIELNRALARAGIAAWETDLAELIVQLGGDLPSHILVPAIHRNREEVQAIFARAMGQVGRPAPADLAAEPAALAEAARLHLREKFLRAKVAISGANAAVAETGTVVVVESEGNGRMCLSLPEVLVTVMGVEKVVPRWQDLEVLLALLARSATAERMSPYTSMWTGVTPGDGPAEFHLVLLDNGRSLTLADPLGRTALRCIRCSACLNVCPVYERTGGRAYGSVYPGPIGAILTPQLRGLGAGRIDPQTASLPYASTLCGACADVCPVRIDIPELLLELRAAVVETEPWRARASEALLMRGLGVAFGGRRRFAALERLAGALGRLVARGGAIGRLPLPGWAGAWLAERDLVAPATTPFRSRWRRGRPVAEDGESTGGVRESTAPSEPRAGLADPRPAARMRARR
ncbi:MAG TPA: lactate utilization protein B, partial [Candidatus Binatia bacterium]|nr:lactate utilization protein B [Candidatus Binatia bacterium]